MALHDRLMDNLRTSLPGAVDLAIQSELWNVIDEACRDGWIWRESFPVTLVADTASYSIVPTGTDVVQVLSVAHDTLDVSDAVVEFGNLYLTTVPTAADVALPLIAVLVLTPALSTGADVEGLIPADMWTTFHQLWLSGTLARMMAQPAKPYSNVSLALFHGRRFKRDLALARQKIRTGSVPGAQLWRFPRWA